MTAKEPRIVACCEVMAANLARETRCQPGMEVQGAVVYLQGCDDSFLHRDDPWREDISAGADAYAVRFCPWCAAPIRLTTEAT